MSIILAIESRNALSGRVARQEIEEVTDRNFARLFATLEDDRFEAMIELLDKLSA